MPNATFSAADMTTYCGLEELGLVAVGLLGERRAFLGAIRCGDCRCRRPRRGNAVGARGAVGR